VTRDDRIAAALRPVFAAEAAPLAASLAEAAGAARADEVADGAHRLLGMAASVHETAVADAARALERAADGGAPPGELRERAAAVTAAVAAALAGSGS
jgi:HPt (histidine-containing phosphotransfer) domain-containing protein